MAGQSGLGRPAAATPLEALEAANRDAVEQLVEIRRRYETPAAPIVISGCIGPRGDGYQVGAAMSVDEARTYHCLQTRTFAATEADLVTAITMTYAAEAVGIAQAARDGGDAGRDLLHRRDRRSPAIGSAARRRDRRPSTRRPTPTPPTTWSIAPTRPTSASCSRARRRGHHDSAACAPTLRRSATPSWTRPRHSTAAIRSTSPPATRYFARLSRRCGFSVGAVAPATNISLPSSAACTVQRLPAKWAVTP